MRKTAILIGISLAFMALVPLASFDASAAAEFQFLRANNVLSSDATFHSDVVMDPEALNRINPDESGFTNDFGFDDNYWDATPGCVLWGDAESATDGSYGTGEVRFEVEDLAGEVADYYYLEFWIWTIIVYGVPPAGVTYPDPATESISFRLGFGYTDAASGSNEFINSTYVNVSASSGAPFETTAGSLEWYDIENGAENRPFTLSEMNHLYVVIQMRFDPGGWGALHSQANPPYNLGICYTALRAVPTTHTPETPQTGSFVLRPDMDIHVNGFENQTVSDNEGMYGALNETNQHGDAEQSYINASWDKSAFVSFGFTDPPAWATDIDYRVTLWTIIRHTETGIGTLYSLTMSISSDGYDQKSYYPSTSYTNNTHDSDYVPGGADWWTLTDLEDIIAHLWLGWTGATPSGELRVTQLAFLVTPVVPGDYVPPTGDYEFEDVLDFFGEGNGFSIIFAVIGGIGLIATAPLMIMYYKEGRESGIGAIALGACMIAASLGFLIVGTNAWA